jgi:hypothetical protein
MRKLALWLLLAGFASTALAATRVSVGQVEQLLSASHNLPDAKLAAKISGLELVERASSARLARWQNDFSGKRTREALLALADASSFLDLPPAEILPKASPDSAAQSAIFQRAVAYADTTIKKLPNFSARRSTTHFDDVLPMERFRSQFAVDPARGFQAPLAPGSQSSSSAPLVRFGDPVAVVVTYRDGEEVVDSQAEKDKKPVAPAIGLSTYGEFGPILSVVTGDAMHGKVFWSHWEQGATGPLAVFRFLVHQEDSHFTVLGAGNMSRCPSYHGEIAVDPATGTMLRVTLVSDWKPPFQPSQSAIVVEYGPVQIGNATYTCPIKGVAISKVPNAGVGNGGGELDKLPHLTFVNDVSFTEYHVFRAEVRILPQE